MDFNEYQKKTQETAIYPGQKETMGLLYVSLGLGECGEFQNKVKKILRDKNGLIDDDIRHSLSKELGDILYYVARCCEELNLNLGEIAEDNLVKLASRKERGVLKGNGDSR